MRRYYLAIALAATCIGYFSSAFSQVLIIIPGQSASCPPPMQQQFLVAINKARETLPKFWEYYKTAWFKSGRFEALLMFQRENRTNTTIWVSVTSVAGATVEGTLLQSDSVDKKLIKGAVTVFNKNDPLDWGLLSNGGKAWYGRYALRESLPQCDKKNRETMLSVFLTGSPAW